MTRTKKFLLAAAGTLFLAAVSTPAFALDPLPSWNDGKTKSDIVHFVSEVTNEKGPSFVPQSERIATFDNDGTLWLEQPLYTQLQFALDRVKALAPLHPEWRTNEPYKSILEGDMKALFAGGEKSIFELMMTTHSGMTTAEFDQTVKQ